MKARILIAALPLLSAAAALGQTTPPAASATEASNDLIVLPAFEVRPSSGYTVEDSSSGARVAVKLNTHPFTINTVTADFISDFAGFELRDWFSYTPAFAVQEGEGNYIVRGQKATGQLRNGFMRSGMIDRVNIDRAEVIKGPAAAIYGRTAPGGLVNIITKKAPSVPMASIGVQAGAYGLLRGQLSLGGPIIPDKLFMRFDASRQVQDETHDFYTIKNEAYSLATLWRLNRNTAFTIEFEYVEREDTTDSELRTPFIWTANAAGNGPGTQTFAPDESMKHYNYESDRKGVTGLVRESWTTNFNLDHRINDTFALRIGGFIADRPATRTAYDGERWVPSLKTFFNRRPLFRHFAERADGFQADLTAKFETGPIKHTALLTGDYLYTKQTDQIYRLQSTLVNNLLYNRPNLDITKPDFWFPFFDPTAYNLSGRDRGSRVKYSGGFLSDRLAMLDERLHVLVGMRYTHLNTKLYDNNVNNTPANPFLRRSQVSVSATDPQIGFTYAVIKPVSLFASYSSSTREQTLVATNNSGNLLTDPEKGKGYEAGVKLTSPDNRYSITASYFDQDRTNVVRTDPVTQENVLTGEENSKGVELSGAINITQNWQVMVSGCVMDARFTKPSRALQLVIDQAIALGVQDPDRITQAPEEQYSIAMLYKFTDGALKGLSLNAGWKYYGNQITSNGNITSIQYRQPCYRHVDLGASYTFRIKKDDRLRHTVRLNVKNLLDEEWYFGDRKSGRGLQFILGYDLSFR